MMRLLIILSVLLLDKGRCDIIRDEELARIWLNEYNTQAENVYYDYVLAQWNYNTNLTTYNQQKALEGSTLRAQFRQEAYQNTTLFAWRNFTDADLRRQFSKVADIGLSVLKEDQERLNFLNSEMEMIYSVAQVCKSTGECYPLDPELTNILGESRDWDELAWAWKGWRDETGRKMKSQYEEFVALQNKAAKMNLYADAGEYWRSWYEDDDFENKCLQLWEQVKPLYQQLHAYVKRKLQQKYIDKDFPDSGHIPAHILGNMWAQQWSSLGDLVTPYEGFPPIDVTSSLINQNYTAKDIFEVSEEFFTSLGLKEMPDSFWENSMIVKPTDGRKVVCHASAWDFYSDGDFRIKQCTSINQDWLITTHHEMGHIQYYLQYKDLPVVYRRGANPGFHEAVGDVLALSVSTPDHLQTIGLLDTTDPSDEYDINFLMGQALDKIAFLPFGYLIDQWRWSVFRGETTPDQYNRKWWELRCQHQGISPPVARSDEDFDPGAKYHIPGNTPYIRYFVSFVIQFQFHKALCDAAGYEGPLHRCDIYKNIVAGTKLADMLKLGSSQPWPVAMQAITGKSEMDVQPLLEFFKPLTDWLEEQNANHDISWEDKCPEGSFVTQGGGRLQHAIVITVAAILFVLVVGE